MTSNDLLAVVPEMVLGVMGMLLILTATVRGRPRIAYVTGVVALVLALLALAFDNVAPATTAFMGTYALDRAGLFAKAVFIVIGIVTILAMDRDLETSSRSGEAPAFVIFGTLAACLLAEARDLALIAVALTMLATSAYGLLGSRPHADRANEATLKFFVLSAVTGAVTLYGFGLLFGLGHSLNLDVLSRSLAGAPAFALGFAIVLSSTAFVFEAALVPIAEWVPDVYDGAATSVALWMSIVPKTAALVVFARMTASAFQGSHHDVVVAIGIIAIASQLWGNAAAFAQSDLKRLLAYSGIAQAGFMLCAVALAGLTHAALDALIFYVVAYAAMNGLAFASLLVLERRFNVSTVEGLIGIGATSPWMALALTAALLSLAGFPPFVGFAAKVTLLQTSFSVHEAWLGIAIAANSVVALGYYLGPIARMWSGAKLGVRPAVTISVAALVVTGVATIAFGIAPQLALPR